MATPRILIVDDEEDLVKALSMRLKSAGYEVLVATDGLSATQIAIREQPDLIVLDIGMPGGDGHTVAARLKKNLRTMSIPVIYLTARASHEDVKKASDVGAAGYLLKPFQPGRLLSLVEKALSAKSHGATD